MRCKYSGRPRISFILPTDPDRPYLTKCLCGKRFFDLPEAARIPEHDTPLPRQKRKFNSGGPRAPRRRSQR